MPVIARIDREQVERQRNRDEAGVTSAESQYQQMETSIQWQQQTLERLLTSETSRNIVRGAYYALPKVFDLGRITRSLVLGNPIDDWMPVWSSGLFGVVVLGAGIYLFARKNY